MDIEKIKNLQNANLEREVVINNIKEILPKYSLECDRLNLKNSVFIEEIIINDIYNFFEQSGLTYSMPLHHRFDIDNTDIRFTVADEGFTIRLKEKDLYITIIISLDKKYKLDGYINNYIRFDNDLIYSTNEHFFIEKLETMDVKKINEIFETIKIAIDDVEKASNKLDSFGDDYNTFEHEYYKYENEDVRYKTIKEIIEHEI